MAQTDSSPRAAVVLRTRKAAQRETIPSSTRLAQGARSTKQPPNRAHRVWRVRRAHSRTGSPPRPPAQRPAASCARTGCTVNAAREALPAAPVPQGEKERRPSASSHSRGKRQPTSQADCSRFLTYPPAAAAARGGVGWIRRTHDFSLRPSLAKSSRLNARFSGQMTENPFGSYRRPNSQTAQPPLSAAW